MTFKEKKEYFQWWINEEETRGIGNPREFLQGMLFGLQKSCTNSNQKDILQKMFKDYVKRSEKNDRF